MSNTRATVEYRKGENYREIEIDINWYFYEGELNFKDSSKVKVFKNWLPLSEFDVDFELFLISWIEENDSEAIEIFSKWDNEVLDEERREIQESYRL